MFRFIAIIPPAVRPQLLSMPGAVLTVSGLAPPGSTEVTHRYKRGSKQDEFST